MVVVCLRWGTKSFFLLRRDLLLLLCQGGRQTQCPNRMSENAIESQVSWLGQPGELLRVKECGNMLRNVRELAKSWKCHQGL